MYTPEPLSSERQMALPYLQMADPVRYNLFPECRNIQINISEKQFQKFHAGENGQASRNNISCTIGQKKLNRWNHNGKREGMLRTAVEFIFSKLHILTISRFWAHF